MAKYESILKADFNSVVSNLERTILDSGISMNLVDQINQELNGTKIAFRVYDKYFMRNSSRASLSLTIVGHEDNVLVSAIGAGGGQGVFLNFSLGAESELVEIVEKCVNRMVG